MHKVLRTAVLLAIFNINPVYASENITDYTHALQPVGKGRLSVLMMDVYDAVLFAPGGHWTPHQTFALQLTYLRDIKGTKIADRSVEEMRKIGFRDEIKLAAWHSQMRRIFPDVDSGTKLTGILTQKGETIFFRDRSEIGRIKDTEFGKAFFGIWLSEKTSAPDLRQQLLGTL